MHDTSSQPGIMGRRIGVRIGPTSLVPRVLEALRALGYTLVDLDSDRIPSDTRDACGLWLVDQDRLDELPGPDVAGDRRILLISSSRSGACTDPRVFSTTRRPARLAAVYEMIQSALESTPRASPRVRTRLSARCIRGERRSPAAVLSLSEGGCLLRSGEPLEPGSSLHLQFALPTFGVISTPAECRYARAGEAGLAFSAPDDAVRHEISHFVTARLAAHADGIAGSRSGSGSLSA